jgi:hypothetical protein
MDCDARLSSYLAANAMGNVTAVTQQIPDLVGKSRNLEEAYEKARIAAIESLYTLMKKEIGIEAGS